MNENFNNDINNNNNNNYNNYTNFDVSNENNFLEFKKKNDEQEEKLLSQLKIQAKQIKKGQKLINSELVSQEPLINQIDDDMNNLDSRMIKQTNTLKKYLEKTSDSCLYWTIGIEIFFLFLFFMI